MVCIEQLLSDEALQALQRFCTESSIWFQSRFRFEVGSNLPDGFSCPLLLQIAGELRERFSPILGPHLFKTCWAYKYYQSERPGHLHADDNAISFNVWITPDEANEDPGSGGLILWNKKVPAAYFDKPSERQAIVKTLTTAQDATSQTVPYGCNRAILFNGSVLHNSDLHALQGQLHESKDQHYVCVWGAPIEPDPLRVRRLRFDQTNFRRHSLRPGLGKHPLPSLISIHRGAHEKFIRGGAKRGV